MNYQESVKYILDIPKFTVKNHLTHTKEFLLRLGNPQVGRKVIHVAGTNGKGSVCAYIQALLLAEKKRTGFFSSPHLVKINERIRINGEEIDDETFLAVFQKVKTTVDEMEKDGLAHPTFFEFLFGMAMTAFAMADMEYIVLETGLGGRLDATNAIDDPVLTVITAVGMDHMEILGDTIEKLQQKRAGSSKDRFRLCSMGIMCRQQLFSDKLRKIVVHLVEKSRKMRTKFRKSQRNILHFQNEVRMMKILHGGFPIPDVIRWTMHCLHWRLCSFFFQKDI